MAKMNYMEPIFFTPPRNKLDRALYKDSPSPAPAPTSQTVTNTSIPEYARPYVERMMGKSEALTDINKNPYQTYGGSRIAEFSPLQKQAFQNVAGMQTADQLGAATGLAGVSGLGSIGAAGRMAGAGGEYARTATNPYAVQAYMNPYLQASLQPQLAEIQRQSDITGMGLQGQATAQGAFGGNRAALQQAENARNALMAKQQTIGQGYNTAFQNAQQAQQFGANLGLQGLQGALAGYGQAGAAAGTLGQLGQTQFGQQQAINTAQQQVGAVQQAQQQQQLDQAYQDFLKQKNYPYQQLAFMSDMLRGLPLSQSAQQQYTAPPSMVSQLGGLGMAGLGIYGASGGFKAEGGAIKEKKYADGGSVKMMTDEQLQKIITDPTSNPLEAAAAEEQMMLRARMRNNPTLRSGVASIATDDLVPETMAGGGIIAFADRGQVSDPNAPGISEADAAYYEALRNNWVTPAAGQFMDYTIGLPITLGKKGYESLKGETWTTDPKTGKLIKRKELPAVDTKAAEDEAFRAKTESLLKERKDFLAKQPESVVDNAARRSSTEDFLAKDAKKDLNDPYYKARVIAGENRAKIEDDIAAGKYSNTADVGATADKGLPIPRTGARVSGSSDFSELNYKAPEDVSGQLNALKREVLTPEQYMAQHQARIGENEGLAAIKAKLAGMESRAAAEEERAPWMALTKAGLATMASGTDPKTGRQLTPLEALGRGAQEGFADYTQSKKDAAAAEERRFALSTQVAQAERAEKLAAVKYGEDSEQFAKAHNDTVALKGFEYSAKRASDIAKGEADAAAAKIDARLKKEQLGITAGHYAAEEKLARDKLELEKENLPRQERIAWQSVLTEAGKNIRTILSQNQGIPPKQGEEGYEDYMGYKDQQRQAATALGLKPTPTASGAIKVSTQDEYNKLKSGTTYIAPDGTIRTKP